MGDGGSKFLCRSDDGNYATRVPAVALLFVNERDRSPGEFIFHFIPKSNI